MILFASNGMMYNLILENVLNDKMSPFFREAPRRKIKEERVDFVVVISNLSVFMRSIRVVAFYDL